MTAAWKGESGRENVNSRCRSSEAMGNARVWTYRHAHGRPEAKQRQEPNLFNLHNTIARQGLKAVFFVREKDSKKFLNAVVAEIK
jgi:hypothetical protein